MEVGKCCLRKSLTFREHFGDYQRQLFLMDHAGLPLTTVLEQLDLLGEVVPAGSGLYLKVIKTVIGILEVRLP